MDPDLYKAAAKGKIDAFKDQTLDSLLTPKENTVLHIYLTATKEPESTDFVEEILKRCPSLLWKTNTKKETPLHMAARYGHSKVAEFLINRAKDFDNQDLESGIEAARRMIRMTNKEKNTALHEAARYGELEVVKLLTKEDRYFEYAANDADETPLYLAVESESLEVVSEILETCRSPAHGGPLGRTALHVAAYLRNKEMIRKIVEKKGADIMKEADQEGWTPLHYAAYYNYSCDAVKLLLKLERKLAYMKDKEGRTALHIAADRDYLGQFAMKIMKEIISRCPDCCEIVDKRGRNVFHYIALKYNDSLHPPEFKKNYNFIDMGDIFGEDWSLSFSNLLNEKDADGSAPIHLYSDSLVMSDFLINHPRVNKMAYNKQNKNVDDITWDKREILPGRKRRQILYGSSHGHRRVLNHKIDRKAEDDKVQKKAAEEERKKNLKEAAQTHLIVATLIATVTFAAGIAMPGGYIDEKDRHPGTAILAGNAAFKAFVIFNTIAMVLSSCAVLFHLLFPQLFWKSWVNSKIRGKSLDIVFRLIILAIGAMVLAFITGTYAVLAHSSGLAIPTCIIGLCFFVITCILYILINHWIESVDVEWD